jgi:sugar transferase (PEP-CTERM/EpsH1 system associated)
MRILFVCHRVPFPPKRGGKIRPFNVIRHLSASTHEVTVASLARSREELAEADGLRQYCAHTLVETISDPVAWGRMLARAPSLVPSSFGYFHSPRLKRRIHAELAAQPYDLIFVHCSSVAPYVEDVQGVPKVIDFGDMDSQKWREYSVHRPFPRSLVYHLEALKLERAERRLGDKFDFCTCTTHAEWTTLAQLGIATPSGWFPNGVDTEFFRPAEAVEYDPDLIAFVGRMDYYPNQQAVETFCRDVLPPLQAWRASIRLDIVGANPSAEIRKLGELAGVTVTGTVPDVRRFVTRAALTIAPLAIARGTQNKILESMAMGVPVVCSPQAAGGVDAVPGEHVLVADAPGEYVAKIRTLLESADVRHRFAAAARARVLSHHTWPSSMKQLDKLLAEATRICGAKAVPGRPLSLEKR